MDGKYFLYDPEGDGFQTFATAAERDEAAAKALPLYIVDGEWDEEVFGVVAGEITHTATKTDVLRRPDALNENDEDEAGEYWSPNMAEKFNITLQPHPTPASSSGGLRAGNETDFVSRKDIMTNDVVQSILNRSESYRQIVKKVEEQIPPELIAAMGLCGWNAFGMFETVLLELKKAKLPICCPHCISGCNACGPKKWLL